MRWLQRDPPNLTEALKGSEKIIEARTLAAGIIDRLRSLCNSFYLLQWNKWEGSSLRKTPLLLTLLEKARTAVRRRHPLEKYLQYLGNDHEGNGEQGCWLIR